ncbi:uncharacterized protein N7443_004205 [Penicillium atrosanguineum]|uniref:Uncharacterized protein n=1 Tax=Penicillium atrosanguineum TaxID=1132637 RepID=A0A9W9Q423_9EURO|nr:uncharacterized protein N7443_004205 [Penicillium atrosanguineum]KAJ5134167.1 hypothetical protein N7526_005532 [Penicillium atrosanguineum]KAJ5304545.1 hypothetical protein N7443_004205 [Penicillium atrosanguineum]KAJ5324014.1 hypothetical protein N7476_002614 [Penicillium atrosanguineum]
MNIGYLMTMTKEHDGGTGVQLELFKFLARSSLTQGTGIAFAPAMQVSRPQVMLGTCRIDFPSAGTPLFGSVQGTGALQIDRSTQVNPNTASEDKDGTATPSRFV